MIVLENITRTYRVGKNEYPALKETNLLIGAGEFVAVTGKSGAGKSTLLNIIGCIDRPTSGSYILCGERIAYRNDGELAGLRNSMFGFVMQDYALIGNITAYDNILIPTLIRGKAKKKADIEAAAARVGITDLLKKNVNHLSGGERQRVSIARALINEPKILLADEPTGNLDRANAEKIVSLFEEINRGGVTVIAATHDPEMASRFRRRIELADGVVIPA